GLLFCPVGSLPDGAAPSGSCPLPSKPMKRSLRAFLKGLVGWPLRHLYRQANLCLIFAERRALMKNFGHCESDLLIVYPWDIRGEGHVFIGKDVFIGPSVLMIADKGAEIHIGDKVMFGPQVKVIGSDHRVDDPSRPI